MKNNTLFKRIFVLIVFPAVMAGMGLLYSHALFSFPIVDRVKGFVNFIRNSADSSDYSPDNYLNNIQQQQQSILIKRGHLVIEQLIEDVYKIGINGDTEYLTDIIAVVLYFYNRCGGFKEGTFIVYPSDVLDPDISDDYFTSRLFVFLSSYPHVYKRISSHFTEYKNLNSQRRHYGIDIPKDLRSDLFLPEKKYHILFGHVDNGGIFIKPEDFGTKQWGDFFWHSIGYIKYLGRKYLGFGFEIDGWKEERVSKTLFSLWEQMVAKFIPERHVRKIMLVDASEFGIKGMMKHSDKFPASLANNKSDLCVQAFYNFLQKFNPKELVLRKGNEAIFTKLDFIKQTYDNSDAQQGAV